MSIYGVKDLIPHLVVIMTLCGNICVFNSLPKDKTPDRSKTFAENKINVI